MRLHVTPESRRRRLIRRAMNHRDTIMGSGEAARNTPRKISDAASMEISPVIYQYTAVPAASTTLAIKWNDAEKNFFKDVQLLSCYFYRGIIAQATVCDKSIRIYLPLAIRK